MTEVTDRTPIDVIHLFAHGGPNIFGPQPGVLLRVRCDKDRSRRIRDALKDGAQSIGLILGQLEVNATAAADGFVITARFTTPMPDLGAGLASYVVEGVRALATGDEAWDRDGPLYELQKRRRREGLPVAALQLLAEARRRDLPALRLPDGRVQFGYGARGWSFEPGAAVAEPPWAHIGTIPIYAVTGADHTRAVAVVQVAAQLRQMGHAVSVIDGADDMATAALLAEPATEVAVVGLDSGGILRRGLAFVRCAQVIVAGIGGARPPEALDDEEWLRAAGVPMLVAREPALISRADPRLAALEPYAPHGVVWI